MDRESRIERVCRLAAVIRLVVLGLWVTSGFFLLVALATLDGRLPSEGALRIGSVTLQVEDWCGGRCSSLGDYGAGFLARAAIHLGGYFVFWMWGTWSFERLLRLYERGRVFGRETAQRINAFGIALFGWAMVDLWGGVVWMMTPHAEITPLASISTALIGAVFVMIAWVMGEAAELAEEVELTV